LRVLTPRAANVRGQASIREGIAAEEELAPVVGGTGEWGDAGGGDLLQKGVRLCFATMSRKTPLLPHTVAVCRLFARRCACATAGGAGEAVVQAHVLATSGALSSGAGELRLGDEVLRESAPGQIELSGSFLVRGPWVRIRGREGMGREEGGVETRQRHFVVEDCGPHARPGCLGGRSVVIRADSLQCDL